MIQQFATAINCMDGRTQQPVLEYMQRHFDVAYVDMITEPGPNKILAEGEGIDIIESIKKKVAISVKKHHSQFIAIAAHYDCAGNPVDETLQREQLRKARTVIISWGFPVKEVVALWLDKSFKVSLC